jgi:hypothetical protein
MIDTLYWKIQLSKIPDQTFRLAANIDLADQHARRADHAHAALSERRRSLHNTSWLFLS